MFKIYNILLQTANLMSEKSHEKGLVVFHLQHLTPLFSWLRIWKVYYYCETGLLRSIVKSLQFIPLFEVHPGSHVGLSTQN